MTFRDDNGNTIQYDGKFAMTKQVANFFNFKIKGDVSIDFLLDNNSAIRHTLGYFGAQQVNSPAFSKTSFSLIDNSGNILSKGFIVIAGNDEDHIRCYYVSGNTNWFQTFSGHLKDIVFDNKYTILMSAITGQVAAIDGIIFPIVDWAYQGMKRGYIFMNTNMVDYLNRRSDQIQEIFPCLYLHTVVEQMANTLGVKINGTLTSDAIYQRMVITPSGPDLAVPDAMIKNTISRMSLSASQSINFPGGAGNVSTVNLNLKSDNLSPQFDTTLFRFNVYITGTYEFFYSVMTDDATFTTYGGPSVYVNGTLKSEGVAKLSIGGGAGLQTSDWVILNLNAGDYVELKISNLGVGAHTFNVLTSSYFYTQIRKMIQAVATNSQITNASQANAKTSYVIPNSILPDITCLDLIKFLSNFFGAICSYNQYSKTLTLNLISKIRKESATDWSNYYVTHENNFQTGAATNNFIQTPAVDDDNIKTYNNQSLLLYGGGNYTTSYTIEKNRDVYTSPFAGSWDAPSRSGLGVFMPYIKFYELTDNFADSFVITQVLNNAGRAEFSNPAGAVTYLAGDLIRISGTGIYDGYAIVQTVTATSFILYGIDYISTQAGGANKVDTSTISGPNRILLVKPNQNIADIGFPSPGNYFQFQYYSNTFGVNAPDTSDNKAAAAFAWFDKQKTGLTIDQYNESLSMSTINNRVFNNTIDEVYLGPIKSIYNNPLIKATMRLPISVFQSFDFSQFVYIRAEELEGYFMVESIINYQDSITEVECNLYML